jgi:hypothetical protein
MSCVIFIAIPRAKPRQRLLIRFNNIKKINNNNENIRIVFEIKIVKRRRLLL